jgi:hypothetical protein
MLSLFRKIDPVMRKLSFDINEKNLHVYVYKKYALFCFNFIIYLETIFQFLLTHGNCPYHMDNGYFPWTIEVHCQISTKDIRL